eukprot:scaffold60280_cov70-Phaeocystis_antarctica.AAC.1
MTYVMPGKIGAVAGIGADPDWTWAAVCAVFANYTNVRSPEAASKATRALGVNGGIGGLAGGTGGGAVRGPQSAQSVPHSHTPTPHSTMCAEVRSGSGQSLQFPSSMLCGPGGASPGNGDRHVFSHLPPGANEGATVVVGTPSTVRPSTAEAASAVPRVEESEVCTSSAVMEAGTAMVAVTRTLAAATRIVTSDLSTPAASATFCCKLDLSLSEKSLTLPLAVSVSTTVPTEGSGDGGAGGAGGSGGGGGGDIFGGGACPGGYEQATSMPPDCHCPPLAPHLPGLQPVVEVLGAALLLVYGAPALRQAGLEVRAGAAGLGGQRVAREDNCDRRARTSVARRERRGRRHIFSVAVDIFVISSVCA